jgi:hypothetical protein
VLRLADELPPSPVLAIHLDGVMRGGGGGRRLKPGGQDVTRIDPTPPPGCFRIALPRSRQTRVSEPLPAALTRNVYGSSTGGHRYMRSDSKRATRWGWPLIALLSVTAGVLSMGY